MKDLNLKFGIARLFTDFFSLILAWIFWYYIRLQWDFIPFLNAEVSPYFPEIKQILPFIISSSIAYIIIAGFHGLYKIHSEDSRIKEIWKIIYNNIVWGLLIIAFYALWKHELFFSRIYLFQVWILSIFLIILNRSFLRMLERFFLRKWLWTINILVIWKDKLLEKIKSRIYLSPQFKIIKNVAHFDKNININWIDEIWLLNQKENKKEIIDFCQINQIWFRFRPDTEWVLLSHLENSIIWWIPLLSIIPTPIYWWGRIQKRILDTIASFFILLLLSPVFLIIWLLIKKDSKWPIFYWSKRIWKNWKHFKMWKFRSMIINAEELKEKLMKHNQRKWPLFKIKWDPRITKFWNFIRRFSIDELPQLWNVLKWEMSLVWPRAHLPDEVQNYTELQKRVLTIKPWITGLAQINGRSDLDFQNEIKLDLQYIEHWSVLLDIQITIQTPLVLLKGDGAD